MQDLMGIRLLCGVFEAAKATENGRGSGFTRRTSASCKLPRPSSPRMIVFSTQASCSPRSRRWPRRWDVCCPLSRYRQWASVVFSLAVNSTAPVSEESVEGMAQNRIGVAGGESKSCACRDVPFRSSRPWGGEKKRVPGRTSRGQGRMRGQICTNPACAEALRAPLSAHRPERTDDGCKVSPRPLFVYCTGPDLTTGHCSASLKV